MRARTLAPVRTVRSRGGNVITLLASQKMGREIRTESRHIEFAGAVNHEFDSMVLEYYAQPCELKLELVDQATGEIRAIRHFPDFLVIRGDGLTLEEWKPEEKLNRLQEKYPYRYEKDSDVRWYSSQIEEQLAAKGIRYRIFSEKDLPRRRVENLLHLADYFHPDVEPVCLDELARLQAVLREQGTACLAELTEQPLNFDADMLNKAIADQLVVASLDHETLTQPRRARLFRDATLRDFSLAQIQSEPLQGFQQFALDISVGARIQYENQELTISLIGEQDIVCSHGVGKSITLGRDWLIQAFEEGSIKMLNSTSSNILDLARYSEDDLKIAVRRQALLQSGDSSSGVSDRTLRRWIAKQSIARSNGANEALTLVPQTLARGNRISKLSDEQKEQIDSIFQTHWRNNKAPSYKSCYLALTTACEAAGVRCPSYPTLISHIKSQETSIDHRVRYGKRMTYQLSEFVDVLHFDTPQHGSRPFQYVHIDHTQLDIEVISSRTGKPLGRPWFSLAVDSWSRRIVGLYLTFDAPSYRTVMMVVRDMVKRYQRLPEFIVVDNGSDFIAEAFQSFMQVMGVHLRYRPAGNPRHGAILERMFGRANTEYIHNLAGNTKATKNVRMTTGKHMPVNFAVWTLEALYFGLQHWATEFYDKERHPALDCSPHEAHVRGLRESGSRPQRQILCNKDFLISTCPPADRSGVRTVNGQRGVKVNDMLYWNPEFRNQGIAGQSFPVRYDPWDASSVYVRIKERWIHAQCRSLIDLGQLTEVERKALTEEYRNHSGDVADDERSRQRLREFMQVFTPEGALESAFERQAENKSLYNQLQLSSINPVALPMKISLEQEITEVPTNTVGMSSSFNPPPLSKLPIETAEDNLPDFDTF
jgi:putative transposase